MFEINAPVVSNRFVSGITWEIVLRAKEIAQTVKPGQFVMLQPRRKEQYDPLNRRPFAVADTRGEEISIYYDVVGRGTKLLTAFGEGDNLKVLGPLGGGLFPIFPDKKALVVAGGIGASGVSLLVKKLAEEKIKTVVLYGARNKDFLSMRDWYQNVAQKGVEVHFYTDDGSYGKKGFPVQDLDTFADPDTVIYACGPKPLLRYIKEYSLKRDIEAYLSLDRRMACGWGVCLGCVVKTSKGYERVCKEGPVFSAKGLIEF